MVTKEHEHHSTHHASAEHTAVKDQAEAEMKRKGLKPVDSLVDAGLFTPISVDDQRTLHGHDLDAWKKLHGTIRELKETALEKARKIDEAKQEEELKLLKVKRYDESVAKPDFLCVVNGCGEPKAPGQGYHCASHCKNS